MPSTSPIWFITGCSTGFGRELAKLVLERGDSAVLTARKPQELSDLVAPHAERALAFPLDVTHPEQINRAVAAAESHFGRIDVLVNNAGYGYVSAIEEGEDAEVRRQFETNVFGLVNLTKQVLPGMRRRRSGHIINLSSIGGLLAFPGTGYYHATKFAVEGLSESLAQEVSPLGIKVTIVEPGRFRTDFAKRSICISGTVIEDYAATVGKRRQQIKEIAASAVGDPHKAAAAILSIAGAANAPLRLLLGADAFDFAMKHLETSRTEFETWKQTSIGTNF